MSRAMVEGCRVKQSKVELCQSEVQPWQSNVESSGVKQTHGRVKQTEVEPWQSNVESNIHEDKTSTKKMPCQVYETSYMYVLISQTMYLAAKPIPVLL